MAVEIERKYLVNKSLWDAAQKSTRHYFRQGYLTNEPGKTIRVRVADETGYLTIKGATVGLSRPEYEYEIPKKDAEELLSNFCKTTVTKYRYTIKHEGKVWEVDEFLGDNEGLIVAEIELDSEEETFALPPWIDREVTGEKKYNNSKLAEKPFKSWSNN